MVYLWIFLGLVTAIIGLCIANIIVNSILKKKKKHSEKGENTN